MAWKQQHPDDNKQGNAAAEQPLLAELGAGGYQHHPPNTYAAAAPVELPVTDHVAQPHHGRESYHAELPDSNSNTARFASPPQGYSAYSPPYERSNF